MGPGPSNEYTFFGSDFVYSVWPESYFVKIISKRINYFEWYSLLFFVSKVLPKCAYHLVPNFEMYVNLMKLAK